MPVNKGVNKDFRPILTFRKFHVRQPIFRGGQPKRRMNHNLKINPPTKIQNISVYHTHIFQIPHYLRFFDMYNNFQLLRNRKLLCTISLQAPLFNIH